jgi:hypothetical protein
MNRASPVMQMFEMSVSNVLPVNPAGLGRMELLSSVEVGLSRSSSHSIESRFRIAPLFVDRRASKSAPVPCAFRESILAPFYGSQLTQRLLGALGKIRTPHASQKFIISSSQESR